MATTFTPRASRDLLLDMRHNKHPELSALIPLEGLLPPLPYQETHYGYCLDCGKFWGNISMDRLFDDVGWHQAGYATHVVHIWTT